MFIELTEAKYNEVIKVNFNNIIGYTPQKEGGTIILLDSEHNIKVKESYNKVKQLEEHSSSSGKGILRWN